MTESGCKCLCACGCGRNITRVTELWHQQAKGPLTLASAILAQNSTLKGGHRKQKLAHQSVKRQLIGCHAPIRNALNDSCSHVPSHNISGHFPQQQLPYGWFGCRSIWSSSRYTYAILTTPNTPFAATWIALWRGCCISLISDMPFSTDCRACWSNWLTTVGD